MAHQDEPCKLIDRTQLYARINHAILDAKHNNSALAVLLLDLDGFSKIDKVIGCADADTILTELGSRLIHALGPNNEVARTGGAEFMILIHQLQVEETLNTVVDRIIDVFKWPFRVKEYDRFISGSFGCAIYPYDGEDLESLIINADTAMYQAKEKGKEQVVFFNNGDLSSQARQFV